MMFEELKCLTKRIAAVGLSYGTYLRLGLENGPKFDSCIGLILGP